jgi:hypothetical protein
MMHDIWASSPTDVYVVGDNESPPGPGTIYHYHGTKWSASRFHVLNGGTISAAASFLGVYGFSRNDVWVVGGDVFIDNAGNVIDSSLVIHFNGIGWHKHRLLESGEILSVWGTDSSNIWFGGQNGLFFHFDGAQFVRINYPMDLAVGTIRALKPDSIYLSSYNQGQPIDLYEVLDLFNGSSFTRIDTTQPYPATPRFGDYSLSLLNPGIIFTSGQGGVFKKTTMGWTKVLDTGNEIIAGMFVCAENNFFAVGWGQVYQYDGEDWYRYPQFSDYNINWTRVWTDGNEVFIIGYTLSGLNKTVILHGK